MSRPALPALILAAGVALTVVILALDEYTHSGHLTMEEGNTLTAILSAIVGALATYLGTHRNGEGGTGSGGT